MNHNFTSLTALLPLALSLPATAADSTTMLDSVVVTATRQTQRANDVISNITIIDKHDLEQAGASTTLGELLGRQSGIEFSRAGGRGADESVFIRGTNSGHALILIDGMRVGSATTGTTAIQMIPLAQIERVEILRGPASALYGSDAIGGVIQIFTKDEGSGSRLAVQAGAGSQSQYETAISHSNRLGNFNYGIKVGSSGLRGINAIESNNYPGYNTDRDGSRNTNFNLNAGYKVNERTEIGAGFFSTTTNSQYDAYQYDPNILPWGANVNAHHDYRMKHRTSGAHLFSSISPMSGWKSVFRLAQGVDRTESPESVIGDPLSIFKTTQNQYAWQNDIALPIGTLLAGLERIEQTVDSTKNYASKSRTVDSAFMGWNASLGAHALQANLRADSNSQFGEHQTWLVGYGYQLAPAWRVAGSLGTAFKAPTMNDLYFPTTPGVGGGNANLKPEESRNAELSLRFKQGASHARLSYYRNQIDNLIEWTTNPVTYFSTPSNVGQAKIEGLELMTGTAIGNWLLNANATYQEAKDTGTGQQLRRRARAFGLLTATYAAGAFKGGAEWKLVGTRYDDPHWQTRLTQVRMGGYTLLNLFAEYAINNHWQAFARIDNLFDRKYDIARSANVIYGTPGLTAFAGIRYTFK